MRLNWTTVEMRYSQNAKTHYFEFDVFPNFIVKIFQLTSEFYSIISELI